MKTILEKTILSEKYPFDYFKNREKLVGLFPKHDELVLEFLKATAAILDKIKQDATVKEFEFDWPKSALTDAVTYAILPFDTAQMWNSFKNSQEFIIYHQVTNQLFPILGWVDCGYKVINDFDFSKLYQPNVMNNLAAVWNAN